MAVNSGSLRTVIRLEDQMSKTLLDISRNAEITNNTLENLAKTVDKIQKQVNTTENTGSTGKKGLFALDLPSIASGLYLFKQIANFASKITSSVTSVTDQISAQKARLNLYNTSEYSTADMYNMVAQTALRTRSDLAGTADLTNRLLASGIYSGDNAVQNTIGVTGLINKALIASGGTAKEQQSVLLQLSQGLAQGQLQGQELKAIRQYAPYIGNILAQGLNMQGIFDADVALGDLKQLGAEGELTTARIIKAFELMSDKINADFEKMPKTWGQVMTNMTTIFSLFLDYLNQSGGGLAKLNERMWQFSDFLTSSESTEFWEGATVLANTLFNAISVGLDLAISGITWLGQNIEAVTTVLGILFLVWSIGWIAAHWQLLAVVAVIGILLKTFSNLGISGTTILGTLVGIIYVIIETVSILANRISSTLAAAFQTLGSIALGILGSISTAIGRILDALGVDWGQTLIDKGSEWSNKAKELSGASEENWQKAVDTYFYANDKSVADTFLKGYNLVGGMSEKFNSLVGGEQFANSGGITDTYVTGGSLDSSGQVSLAEEDIQLLRDISARDFLLNVSTSTPTMTNYFGDIRETADINKILEELDRMVDEEIATSVVMG